jgi:uncharacterized protein (DUF697 family)
MESVIFVVGDNESLSEHTRKLTQLVKERGVETQYRIFEQYQAEINGNSDAKFEGEKVIYVGTEALTLSAIRSWKYERFACCIGWNGSKCVIFAKPDRLPYSDYEEFVKYCKFLALDYEDVVIPPENPKWEVIEHIKKLIGQDNQSVHRAQYSTLIHEFMDNYFDAFINANNASQTTPTPDTGVSDSGILSWLKDILQKLKESTLANLSWTQALLCHAIIHPVSLGCAVIGLIPIPFADAIPITAAQVAMIIGLGVVFDNKLSKSDAEILAKAALAPISGRLLASGAIKLVPGAGWVISGVIAGVITEILGWTIANDFATKAKGLA